jgi:microcystin-dependent protein
MALDFPTSPTDGQTYGEYIYNAELGVWRAYPAIPGGLPAGTIVAWPSNIPPSNWLICDGSEVSRETYASLWFALTNNGKVESAYGDGDGTTTFNLPDLRGRVAVGRSGIGELSILGAKAGASTHTLTIDEIPSHTHIQDSHNHTQNAHNHSQNAHSHSSIFIDSSQLRWGLAFAAGGSGTISNGGSGQIPYTGSTTATNNATTATNNATTATNQDTGGGAEHNNLQPYQVINYIIKYSEASTPGDSVLATRVGVLETTTATTNKSGLVSIIPPTVNYSGGSATANSEGQISFTDVSSISLNNVFSFSYNDYLIMYEIDSESSSQPLFRFRKSGIDSSEQYSTARIFHINATGGFQDNGVAVYVGLTPENAQKFYGELDIRSPFISKRTFMYATSIFSTSDTSDTSMGQQLQTTQHRVTESYDGITMYMLSGNLSGKITVYGRRR